MDSRHSMHHNRCPRRHNTQHHRQSTLLQHRAILVHRHPTLPRHRPAIHHKLCSRVIHHRETKGLNKVILLLGLLQIRQHREPNTRVDIHKRSNSHSNKCSSLDILRSRAMPEHSNIPNSLGMISKDKHKSPLPLANITQPHNIPRTEEINSGIHFAKAFFTPQEISAIL